MTQIYFETRDLYKVLCVTKNDKSSKSEYYLRIEMTFHLHGVNLIVSIHVGQKYSNVN